MFCFSEVCKGKLLCFLKNNFYINYYMHLYAYHDVSVLIINVAESEIILVQALWKLSVRACLGFVS